MQRQSVRQQIHHDKMQEVSQFQSTTPNQCLQNSGQQLQGKHSLSIKNCNNQVTKNQLKQTEHITCASGRSAEHENHLQVLHSKLNSETENILKWKVSTELEIAQKEKKLIETEEIVERQRKNLFELQMHSEQLSQRLQVELKNREELSSKIENTRKICSIIRDHCSKLTNTLNMCVDEKDNLKGMYSQQVKDLEQLQEKYKNIDNNFKTEVEQLEELVREERSQRNKVITEANAMHVLLSEKIEEMAKALHTEMEKSDKLDKQLQENLEKVKTLETEKEENCDQLAVLTNKIVQLETQSAIQKEKRELEVKEALAKMEKEKLRLDMLENQYSQAQKNLLEIETIKEKTMIENSSLIESLENLKALHLKTNEDLAKKTNDCALILEERNKLIDEVETLQKIQVKIKVMENDYKDILQEKEVMLNKLEDALEKIMHFESTNKESEAMLKMYADENAKLINEQSSYRESLTLLNEKLSSAEMQENEMKQINQAMENEFENLRKKLTSLESKFALDTLELTNLVEKGNAIVIKKDEELKTCNEEKEKSEIYITQLQDEQKSHLEKIKNMEEENENLKKTVDCEFRKTEMLNDTIKTISEKNDGLSKDLEDIKSQMSESSAIIENSMAEKHELEIKLDHVQQALGKASQERSSFEQKYEDAVKEREAFQFKADSEIKEMVAVLEKYKRECDGIVNQKEASITKLSSNLEEIQKFKEDLEEQVVNLQKENNSSHRKYADLEKEKDIVEKTLQVKVMDLELKLTAKEKEMAEKEVAQLKSECIKSPYIEKVLSTPKVNTPVVRDKSLLLTPKSGVSPAPPQLICTPHQHGSILKEPNTPGGNKKQVTFQEDTSDTDASSVDAMILDNTDLMSRFEALERGVKMMTPIRVFPSPKNRRKLDQKKMDMSTKNLENNPDYHLKKAKMMRTRLLNEDIDMKINRHQEGSCFKKLVKPRKHLGLEKGQNTGLDLDELFEMVED